MDATVRATCPKCGTVLRIPAAWVGQAVKCKKCGAVVRSMSNGEGRAATDVNSLDGTANNPNRHLGITGQSVPTTQENAFDFSKPTDADDGFALPDPIVPPPAEPNGFNPFGEAHGQPVPPQPAPGIPGYPYPVPPGYPQPGAYAPPTGYPYPAPPGYPYPVPPGYPYPPAPGYTYPVPPGYGPPGAYPAPPGYPYAPPGTNPPEAGNPPAARPQAPTGNGPVKPVGVARSHTLIPVLATPNVSPQGTSNNPYALPEPVQQSNAFSTDDSPPTSTRRYKKGSGNGKLIWVVLCLVMTGGLVTGGIMYLKKTTADSDRDTILSKDPTKLVELLGSSDTAECEAAMTALRAIGPKAKDALLVGIKSDNSEIVKRSNELLAALSGSGSSAKGGPSPRRLLFIHISKYMFLNPVTASAPGYPDKTKFAALRLAGDWRVPTEKDNNQLFLVSDTAPPEKGMTATIPMKSVVTGAYERFFDSSRAQDRIVVYFGGHVVEKDGKAYIAPVEGDLDEPESLIALDDFYNKLKDCKATQKVVIWDVCRFNPNTGRLRPGADPMTESLAKSLNAAPPGVEVVTTCQPGENALEFNSLQVDKGANAPVYSGSAFLESAKSVEKNRSSGKNQSDPIPIAEWAPVVGTRVAAMAAASPGEMRKQTIKVEGKAQTNLVAFNADEPFAKRFDMPIAPKGTSLAEINAIEREFTVPPIKRDAGGTGLAGVPFRDEIMKDYKPDVSIDQILADKETYKFRVTTLDAFHLISDLWGGGGATEGPPLTDIVKAPITDDTKKQIFKDLDFWAIGEAKLQIANAELDNLAMFKAGQPKRWQAHYEYARAVVKSRLAFMKEYNKLMGDVRTETLPALDKALGQDQYKLISSEKMKSKKDVQDLVDEAQAAYTKLITDFKGTPWAIQAKREKSISLGLYWAPTSSREATADKDAAAIH
jgi:hypothetical protein